MLLEECQQPNAEMINQKTKMIIVIMIINRSYEKT